jgi:hypothetical protein
MSENEHTPTAYMVRYTPPAEWWQTGKDAPEEQVELTTDPSCYAAWNFEADITELYSGPAAAAAPTMLEALKSAVEALAADQHLLGAYVPHHSWMPEHNERIQALKSVIAKAEGKP